MAGEILNFTDSATLKWTKGATTGNDPVYGLPIYPLTGAVPVGGVAAKTASYTAVAGDNGTLLSFNSASAVTLTLPATPPSTTWRVAVQNIGAGALTVSPNGLNLDGAAGSLVLAQNSGVLIYTDGTNYFTERGVAPATTGLATIAGVQQESYTYAADTGAANAYAVALSPAPTIVAGSTVTFKAANANTGASTLAVNGGTAKSIKKGGSSALVSGDIAAGQIVTCIYDGTNFQMATGASGGGSTSPLTTKGDLYGYSTVGARVPVGPDGQVLTADSTQTLGLKWAAGASIYAGTGSATAATGNNKIGLGSTPLANSIRVYINGARIAPSAYVIAGSNITLTTALTSGDVVIADWLTSNSTPGTIGLSTAAVLTFVQSTANYFLGSSVSVAYPSANTAGNVLVAIGYVNIGDASAATVSDTKGNTWTLAAHDPSTRNSIGIWYCLSAAAGSNTVTLTGGGGNLFTLHLMEFAGSSSGLDVSGAADGSSTSASATAGGAVTGTDLVIFGVSQAGGGALTFTTPTGFTSVQYVNAGFGLTSQSFYRSSYMGSGTPSAASTISGSCNWQAVIAALKM